MSFDTGGLAQMTYHNQNNAFPSGGLGAPGAGFGGRSRLNNKRLSVALPPKVNPINENSVDIPTPRTSRSHLLAGLRTQPRTPSVPASAPYHQTQHSVPNLGASKWADAGYGQSYGQGVPQTATGASFDFSNQYAVNAGRQMYSLPEQVLAPPSVYEQTEEMDPSVLQQMQLTQLFLAQRQQQLQQQLANITAQAQGMSLNGSNAQRGFSHQSQGSQGMYQQPQVQSQVQSQVQEVQPGVYAIYNPATQSYSYYFDQSSQQSQVGHAFSAMQRQSPGPGFNPSPPTTERSTPVDGHSVTPPKKAPSPPSALEHVEPLPPPSATAFRRGHKKASSLVIDSFAGAGAGPKTSSAATFGSQRAAFPPTPMTGTFGPGNARAGEHPTRQPRGPPPLEELTALPTSNHEGSKNFATRQRRRALDNLMKAGTQRRGVSRSASGSPASEREFNFPSGEDILEAGTISNRKMSPIGSEMKEKRGSQGSNDGYFGLSSASSSEGEDSFRQPPTPATPVGNGDRKTMMLGVLSAAEKRKSVAM